MKVPKTCPQCGFVAKTVNQIERFFRTRTDKNGKVIAQSWCYDCRLGARTKQKVEIPKDRKSLIRLYKVTFPNAKQPIVLATDKLIAKLEKKLNG